MPYRVILSKAAVRHKALLKAAHLDTKARALLDILCENPWQNPPPYEKLVGDLAGCCSRRINLQHRLVYTVDEESRTVRVLSMWTHYEF